MALKKELKLLIQESIREEKMQPIIHVQPLYHGTDKHVTVFHTQTIFSPDWEIAALFAIESQKYNNTRHAYVYETRGDVTEVIRQSPAIEYAFYSVPNVVLGVVYFNNKVVKPLRRFEVTFDSRHQRWLKTNYMSISS